MDSMTDCAPKQRTSPDLTETVPSVTTTLVSVLNKGEPEGRSEMDEELGLANQLEIVNVDPLPALETGKTNKRKRAAETMNLGAPAKEPGITGDEGKLAKDKEMKANDSLVKTMQTQSLHIAKFMNQFPTLLEEQRIERIKLDKMTRDITILKDSLEAFPIEVRAAAKSVEESADSVQKSAATVQQAADTIQQAAQTVQQAVQGIEQSAKEVTEAAAMIKKAADDTKNLLETVQTLLQNIHTQYVNIDQGSIDNHINQNQTMGNSQPEGPPEADADSPPPKARKGRKKSENISGKTLGSN